MSLTEIALSETHESDPKVGDVYVHINSGTKCVIETERMSKSGDIVYDLLRIDGIRSMGIRLEKLWSNYRKLDADT